MITRITWLAVLLPCVALLFGCGGEPQEMQKQDLKAYEVAQIEEVHFANVKRYVWHVVVTEPATKDELKAVVQAVVDEAKKADKFNALAVGLYDYADYIGHGYTLGSATLFL